MPNFQWGRGEATKLFPYAFTLLLNIIVIMDLFALNQKVIKVIQSATTLDQINAAERYLILFGEY